MKKVFAVLLSAAMVLSMTACGGKTEDPLEVYQEAVKKNSELTSVDMTSAMHMNMELPMLSQTLSMDLDMDIQASGLNTDDTVCYSETTVSGTGQNMDTVAFYTDGYYYMETMEQKVKYPMALEELAAHIREGAGTDDMDASMMKEITMEKSGSDRILKFTADPAKVSEYVGKAVASAATIADTGEVNMEIKEVSGEYTVNKEGYYTDRKISMSVTMSAGDMDINMDMDFTGTVRDPGKEVTVTIPSTDGYTEIDPDDLGAA